MACCEVRDAGGIRGTYTQRMSDTARCIPGSLSVQDAVEGGWFDDCCRVGPGGGGICSRRRPEYEVWRDTAVDNSLKIGHPNRNDNVGQVYAE